VDEHGEVANPLLFLFCIEKRNHILTPITLEKVQMMSLRVQFKKKPLQYYQLLQKKERIDIKQRQAEGIALAKKQGKRLGRPHQLK